MIGFVVFEITGARPVLLVFPNVFEFWFVFVAIRLHYWPGYEMTRPRIMKWLVVTLVLKMGQEWVLHGGRYLDTHREIMSEIRTPVGPLNLGGIEDHVISITICGGSNRA